MVPRVLFIADQFADSPRDRISKYPGGAELTDDAVIRASPWPIERIRVQELRPAHLREFDLHLLGNLRHSSADQRAAIASAQRHVLFEHDYRMCRWRGDFAASLSPQHRQLWRCNCLQHRWGKIFESALGAIFLTHRQLNIYRTNPFLKLPHSAVLGCSVMGPEFFEAVQRYRDAGSPQGNGTCVIFSGHYSKGYKQARAWCKKRKLEPRLIRDATPNEVLQTFAASERLVFLPQWPEPASRVAIEARFMGCEVVSNDALGVAGESWWQTPDHIALEFVADAPRRFWAIVESLRGQSADARYSWKRPDRQARPKKLVEKSSPRLKTRPRICIDLTPNETSDRYGGIGRYGYYLLEQLVELPEVTSGQVEILALPISTEPVIPAESALERGVLDQPAIQFEEHRRNRRLWSGFQLQRAHVDLFHAVQPVAMPYLPQCKLVCTIHDLIPIVYPERHETMLKTEYIRRREQLDWGVRVARADHLIAISEWTAKDLMKLLWVSEKKITPVYHGVDARLFNTDRSGDAAVLAKYDLPASGFLCVSSDHYRKNHRTLFEAWASQAASIPESLVFVGHGIYGRALNEIQCEVQKRGLAPRFRWLSAVEDSELPAIYRWARATVAPSLYEGFGMTVIESMACGTPVAVAANGVYQEVGGSAVIDFEGKSASDLGGVLRSLSADDALRARLVQQGLERAAHFTWRRTAEATLDVYMRLLDCSP